MASGAILSPNVPPEPDVSKKVGHSPECCHGGAITVTVSEELVWLNAVWQRVTKRIKKKDLRVRIIRKFTWLKSGELLTIDHTNELHGMDISAIFCTQPHNIK